MKIRFKKYSFNQLMQETSVGVNYTREVFDNYHQKVIHVLSVNYGKGCAYVDIEAKIK